MKLYAANALAHVLQKFLRVIFSFKIPFLIHKTNKNISMNIKDNSHLLYLKYNLCNLHSKTKYAHLNYNSLIVRLKNTR